jgi:thiamine pyrophosphate-dependent acetolactate synthase large subunit-like protein
MGAGRSYDRVADALGATGILVESSEQVPEALARAKAEARQGRPVLVNALISTTDFRAGSISL